MSPIGLDATGNDINILLSSGSSCVVVIQSSIQFGRMGGTDILCGEPIQCYIMNIIIVKVTSVPHENENSLLC